MCMTRERKSFDETERIRTGLYTLEVTTKSHYWKGVEGGKMEEMPGWFMDQKLSLLEIKADDPLHVLAREKLPIRLMGKHREITNEPIGYAGLYHNDFVEDVKDDPSEYISENILRRKLLR